MSPGPDEADVPDVPDPDGADRGLLLGDGLFETIPLHGGRPHRLDLHLHRLASGARALGLPIPPEEDLHHRIREVLGRMDRSPRPAAVPDGRLRLTLTGGPGGAGGLLRPLGAEPVLRVDAGPFHPDPEWWSRGLRAIRAGRVDPDSLLARSGAKHTNYLERILALETARGQGVDEALLSTPGGALVEGSASALLWWDGARLHCPAPGSGALASLTVRILLEELEADDGAGSMETASRPLDPRSLEALLGDPAGELVLASRLRQLVPVVEVDGRPVGTGRPGPVFRTLLRVYRRRVRADLAQDESVSRGRGPS